MARSAGSDDSGPAGSLSGVQAESSDGRAFTLSGPGTRLVAAGDVVVLTPEEAPSWLGQVTRAVRDHESRGPR